MTSTNPDTWLDSVKFNQDGLLPAIAQDQQSGEILMMAWMNAEALKLTAETKTAVYFSRSRNKLWHKGETSGHVQQVHDIYLDCDADVIILSVTQLGGIACHTGRKSCFYRRLDLTSAEPQWQVVAPVLKDPTAIYGAASTMQSSILTSMQSTAESNTERSQATTSLAVASANAYSDNRHSDAAAILSQLDAVLAERKHASPDSSYVASLYHKGLNKILEKVGEEATETILAAKDLAAIHDTQNSVATAEADCNLAETEAQAQHDLVYEIADVWFHTLVTLAWFNVASEQVLAELARRFGLSGHDEKAARQS